MSWLYLSNTNRSRDVTSLISLAPPSPTQPTPLPPVFYNYSHRPTAPPNPRDPKTHQALQTNQTHQTHRHTRPTSLFEISHQHKFAPCRNGKLVQALRRWRWFVFQIFFFIERNHPAVLLIAAVVTILSKEGTKTLNRVITSTLSHLLFMLTHLPLWQVNWWGRQALSCSWTLKMSVNEIKENFWLATSCFPF